MRYRKNPSDWQRYDQETANLRERLRTAQEALREYGVKTGDDPRFQGLRPDAGWPNRELREAVDSVERDVAFYADMWKDFGAYMKKNPRKRQNPARVFRKGDFVTARPTYSEKFTMPGEIAQVEKSGGAPRYMIRLSSGKLIWAGSDQVRKATEDEISWFYEAQSGTRENPRKRRNPEGRHFSSRRLSEVLTQLRYAEKDAEAAERIAVQSNNRADFNKYNKQRIQARQWISFLERLIKRSSPSGAWEATYEFSSRPLPLGASHGERMQRAREIQRAAGQVIAKTISQKRRLV